MEWVIAAFLLTVTLCHLRSVSAIPAGWPFPDPPALACPPVPRDSSGICVELCSSDEDCPEEGQKCCSNGCGHACMDAIPIPPWPTKRKVPPILDCSAVLCVFPLCDNPLPPRLGQCCPICPEPTEPPTVDCRLVRCAKPLCDDPLPPSPGQCCEVCPEPTEDPPLRLICPPIRGIADGGTVGGCVEECSGDEDCNEGEKCCSNGCGHVCTDPIPAPKLFCIYNGRVYKPGQSFPSDDGCNTCTCSFGGNVACTLRLCLPTDPPTPPQRVCKYRGRVYQVGDTFPAGDNCNTCVCTERGEIACTEAFCPDPPACPPDKPVVNCFVDPCRVTDCPAHPDATCVADYCGGCNARFFDRDGNEITDTCEGTEPTCPPDKPMVYCKADPCRVTDCPAHPNATCVADYCGGCNARFFDSSDENEVTDTCDICQLEPDVGPCDAAIPSFFYNSTSERCEKFLYGGCEGNNNRFKSVVACLKRCGPPCEVEGAEYQECAMCPATCENPNIICLAICKPGCGCPVGKVIDEVNKKCVDPQDCPNICTLPPDPGPCKALIPSYFFNSTSAKCERFFYGGCQGNQNRFAMREDCQKRCAPKPACPPECSVEYCRDSPKNKKALCSIPGPREIPSCTGQCQVTYCHACYFSEEPREPNPACTKCEAPVTDLRCLKRWANCVRKSSWEKIPREQRTEENFRCYRYPCPLRG